MPGTQLPWAVAACLLVLLVHHGQARLDEGSQKVAQLRAGKAQWHDPKRWQSLEDIMSAEIKISAKKFLEERGHRLTIPLEVDVIMLGLDGFGAYHMVVEPQELEEVLAAQFTDRDLCPTVWETGHQTSTCISVSYVNLYPTDPPAALKTIERALKNNMKQVFPSKPPLVGMGQHYLPTWEVDAAAVEHVFLSVLNQVYTSEGLPGAHTLAAPPSGSGSRPAAEGSPRVAERLAIFVINPSKDRMSPVLDAVGGEQAWRDHDILEQWQAGKVTAETLYELEGGYTYRYSYQGKGASEAWVSQHNFIVLDLSAGPTSYGPMVTVSGRTAPTGLPRVLPLMEQMFAEIQATKQITQRNDMMQEAAASYQKLLLGQVASAIGAATEHVFVPDIALNRIELAKTVMINLVILHDHNEFNLLDGLPSEHGVERGVDLQAIHAALAQMLPKDMTGVVVPTPGFVHYHPEVLAALTRARISWSDAVVRELPYTGLHHAEHVRLDSSILLEELMEFVPAFLQDNSNNEMEGEAIMPGHFAASVRHNGTRQLHVVVLSLKSAPPGMLFDNGQLVAASHDLIVVLQLLNKQDHLPKERDASTGSASATAAQPGDVIKKVVPASSVLETPHTAPNKTAGGATAAGVNGTAGHEAAAVGSPAPGHEAVKGPDEEEEEEGEDVDWLRVYSGHMQDGLPLNMDTAGGVTARIIGGLAVALGGATPLWERADPDLGGTHMQDWRWAIGCLPWGPYASCPKLSAVLLAAVRRNHLISHIETALQAVQYRLEAVDELVEAVVEGPWMRVLDEITPAAANGSTPARSRRHWLDAVASRSTALKEASSQAEPLTKRLETHLAEMERQLEKLSWNLFQHSTWDDAGEQLHALLHVADALTIDLDEDLRVCQDVAACCGVRHLAPLIADFTLLVMLSVVLLAFGAVAFAVLYNKKIYLPPNLAKRSSGAMSERQPSMSLASGLLSRKSTHSKGLLPVWSGEAEPMLPRYSSAKAGEWR